MTLLIADIETDGLLRAKDDRPEMTRVHCIVTEDFKTGDVRGYWNSCDLVVPTDESVHLEPVSFGGGIQAGVAALADADFVVFHNGLSFDVPAIKRFYGVDLFEETEVRDTQALARLIFPRIGDLDIAREKRTHKRTPKNRDGKTMFGSHSLEAWGWRLGCPKAESPDDFLELTAEMIEYCAQDVAVTRKLWEYLLTFKWPKRSVVLEHHFARYIGDQIHRGVGFDKARAEEFAAQLASSREALEARLQEALGPVVTYTPKKRIRKEKPVNLKSSLQVLAKLKENYGLKWRWFTEKGNPKFDEDTVTEALSEADAPIKDDLLEWTQVKAAEARLATGKQALLKYAVDHGDHYRIHGYVNHNGARNGRCAHSRPNMNLPKAGTPFAEEFRSLIVPRPGWKMVGCDMTSADLRLIAHEVAPFDDGRMIEKITSGDDIHTWNLEHLVRPHDPQATRAMAKNDLYAVAYGAQDAKIGKMHGASKKLGKAIRDAYVEAYLGLGAISAQEQQRFEDRGFVTLLDGRRILPDIPYKALAYKVAGNMAVTFKRATWNAHDMIECEGWSEYGMVLHIHDEFEWECEPNLTEMLGRLLVEAIEKAGRDLDVRCPMTGEYKVGNNWWEVH